MTPIVERITELVRNSGKTAHTILSELEISTSSLSEWKKGKARPSTDAIMKIAKYFNVSADFLLFGEEQLPVVPISGDSVDKDKEPTLPGDQEEPEIPASQKIPPSAYPPEDLPMSKPEKDLLSLYRTLNNDYQQIILGELKKYHILQQHEEAVAASSRVKRDMLYD